MRTLSLLLQSPDNMPFYVFIAAVFSIGLVGFFRPQFEGVTKSAPNLMASIGVLGTFCGIFVGLQGFDVSDIEKSVPPLLAGLKVAFGTSIVGMGGAVVFTCIRHLRPIAPGQAADSTESVNAALDRIADATLKSLTIQERAAGLQERTANSVERLERMQVSTSMMIQHGVQGQKVSAKLLAELHKEFRAQFEGFKKRLDEADRGWDSRISTLSSSITSGTEQTCAALENLGDKLSERQREFITEFRAFADTLLEHNHRAVVEALELVVKEFNKNLTDQFGDNFKQLNQAVGALLEWQENYRAHVEVLESRIADAVASVEASRDALRDIAEEAQKFPDTFNALADVSEKLGQGVTNLNERLTAFAAMRDSAVKAFPEIEKNLRQLTKDFAESVQQTMQSNANVISNHQEALARQAGQLNGLFEQFDTQMQNELNRALRVMGEKLAGLTGKFVDDYNQFIKHYNSITPRAEARQ